MGSRRTRNRSRSRSRSRNGKVRVKFSSGRVAYFKPRTRGKHSNLKNLPPKLANQAKAVMDGRVRRNKRGQFISSSRRRR